MTKLEKSAGDHRPHLGEAGRSMTHAIAVIARDGAGPEVVEEARKAVEAPGLAHERHDLPRVASGDAGAGRV